MSDLQYLEQIAARVTQAQLLCCGTSAWCLLRNLAVELRGRIAEEHAELDRLAANDYHYEAGDPFDG